MCKLLVTLMMLIGSSCGLVQKVAVSTTADMLFDATKEIETEGIGIFLKMEFPAI